MKRNKILFALIIALVAFGSYAFVTPSKTAPNKPTNIAALKAVVQTAKDATSTDIVVLVCSPAYVFYFIGNPGEEHDPSKYVYAGNSFDRDLNDCDGDDELCALVICASWVTFHITTGVPLSPIVSESNPSALDEAIDDAVANDLEDADATDNYTTYVIFTKDI